MHCNTQLITLNLNMTVSIWSCVSFSWPTAVTIWSLHWLPGSLKMMTRLQEVTALGQEQVHAQKCSLSHIKQDLTVSFRGADKQNIFYLWTPCYQPFMLSEANQQINLF